MFSFHKPKIYRSVNGCCICRAKSSSSRFTDSAKYESEFEKCFKIKERRAGEICNACVLLVKRWKKLPPGTTRHWNHVVDARAGPGTKGAHMGRITNPNRSKATKINKKKPLRPPRRLREIESLQDSLAGVYGEERMKRSSRRNSDGFTYYEDNEFDSDSSVDSDRLEAEPETPEVSTASSAEEDEEEWDPGQDGRKIKEQSRQKKKQFKSQHNNLKMSSFIDSTFWRKERICCGVVFKGPHDELLIYPKLLKPCPCRLRRNSTSSQLSHSQVCSRDLFEAMDSNSSVCATSNSDVLLPTSPESLTTSDSFPSAFAAKNLQQAVAVPNSPTAEPFF